MLKITKGLKPFVEGDEITTYTDDRGDEYVRVKIDKEDFCIAAIDYVKDGDDAFKWDDAMKSLEAEGLELPTQRQVEIYKEHIDDINDRLKEIGGVVLTQDFYWTSTENGAERAGAYIGDDGRFVIFPKIRYSFRVRPIINLLKK